MPSPATRANATSAGRCETHDDIRSRIAPPGGQHLAVVVGERRDRRVVDVVHEPRQA
jgi:hypothetical protein